MKEEKRKYIREAFGTPNSYWGWGWLIFRYLVVVLATWTYLYSMAKPVEAETVGWSSMILAFVVANTLWQIQCFFGSQTRVTYAKLFRIYDEAENEIAKALKEEEEKLWRQGS